ncbi:hypothetical protein GVN21_09615 [Caulobacter sp. SLTY]|uniref:hypothetical protein n=1 Tax=Caulobacter sp. SLTY TaxID=2683262 RepID=UPI0014132032|nr:hypothetical protein [Caulobacter sp. SLTY]NBB15609.1 hypothetical protein [Caulobacter sp. SLTY]
MVDVLLLMHDDTTTEPVGWDDYFTRLNELGVFRGGSAIGVGDAFRKAGTAGPVAVRLTGYIRVEVASLAAAGDLLSGNPTYEAGGTVEIRELPRDDG